MKAIVITDQYDDQEIKKLLYQELISYNVEPVEFENLDEFKKTFSTLDQDKPYLFIPTIYLRFDFPHIIKLHSESPFSFIKQGYWTASFLPRLTWVTNDTVSCVVGPDSYSFEIYEMPKLIKPKVSSLPRIITYTHNHDTYFPTTMKSIIYSLEWCEEIPITIVVNNPTESILNSALEFQEKNSNIDVLYSKDNLAFAGMNVAIQWHKPDIIIGAEDDFILPQAAKYLYPLWPYQFALRLKNFTRVGWGVEFQNLYYDIHPDWYDPKPLTRLGWHYFGETYKNVNKSIVLMAQLWMFKRKDWLHCYNKEMKCSADCHFNKFNLNRAMPFLRGYHLSWNAFDGLYSQQLQDKGRKPPETAEITSLKTKETRKIILDDVLK